MSSCALKNNKNRITNSTPCDNYCNYIAHNFMLVITEIFYTVSLLLKFEHKRYCKS